MRSGVRFRCCGDGLCCTDIHAIGPLDDDEAVRLRAFDDDLVQRHQGTLVLTPSDTGRCLFLGDDGCALHARLGPSVKPTVCQQFPMALVATPTGGRLVTEHRCPCRTLGPRDPVDDAVAAAYPSADPDREVEGPLALDADERVPFAAYEEREHALITDVLEGAGLAALGPPPLGHPAVREAGLELIGDLSATRYGGALRAFGAAIGNLLGEPVEVRRPGWAREFDRAEARSDPGDPDAILRDWAADAVWGLDWVRHGTFRQARAEVALRARVAGWLLGRWAEEGTRPDRAAAEAVAVAELAGLSDDWQAAIGKL